ncbi:hypothetical protein AQS8620_01916 [Aquimixticola soesokkakensis]|uniref:DUF1638 domain-containing protein n=1 Tax=Aquimixticola soesokkakensis TaxID=1519096 RepID=A0A1Y5SR56_9RHOB|nr:DUF1638 domain-containing protein [Aquimixticola soesokkakensis]SLN46377.1 hypothetical protein AQS8620_01916 [Aquimixticola soesokkakensis]
MHLPADDILRDTGYVAGSAQPSVLVIACGALAREILALIAVNGWSHVRLTCLPAILHNHPNKITQAVEDAVQTHARDGLEIFVAYADCGTGGDLAKACARMGVKMIAGPHCYAFFDGLTAFAARDEVTSFYLTDFLARQFDAFVWQPLGLDRHPQLLDMYFGNYEKLVYLAQSEDAALTAQAQAAAARLGLAFERRFTGYGDLSRALEAAI